MKSCIVTFCPLVLMVVTKSLGDDISTPANVVSDYEYDGYPKYAYAYSVRDPHTNDRKAQYEVRNGNDVTGGFSFVEPGGSVRIVEYKAGKFGFINTELKRLGLKVHPGGADSQISIAIPINGPYGHTTHVPLPSTSS